jgi:predicted phosphodiesterase
MIEKEELIKLLNENKTNIAVSKILKVSPSTIARWKKKYDINIKDSVNKTSVKDMIKSILSNDILDIDVFSKKHEIEKNKIYEALEDIERSGSIIEKSASGYYINKNIIAQNKIYNYSGKKLKFGVVSDTHLCSKEQQLTHLNTFYDISEDEGITEIYNPGDIVAGDGVYRGQRFETFYQSLDDQANYVIDKYPQRKNIKTHFITGNHDFSFFKSAGADIGEMISKDRKDMIYLGKLGAYVSLRKNIKMQLLHPDGGGSYAESYRLQKIVEGYAPENKPNILLAGHFHTAIQIFIRNVHAFTAGCFESQTPFLLRKGLFPKVGGWIVEIVPADDGSILRIKGEWIPFYKHIYKDY